MTESRLHLPRALLPPYSASLTSFQGRPLHLRVQAAQSCFPVQILQAWGPAVFGDDPTGFSPLFPPLSLI